MQRGCVPCASVSPLLELLSSREGFAAARVENTGQRWFTDAYAVDGSPTWLVLRDGDETGRIDPAGKPPETLLAFFSAQLGLALGREDLDRALAEGRRQADYVESCLAELAFRKPETGEDLLLASIRIKVCKACLEAGAAELSQCVSSQLARIRQRLQVQTMLPEGDTEARRGALDRLPALAERCVQELTELRTCIHSRNAPDWRGIFSPDEAL